MGEQYYLPADFQLTDDTLFSVSWINDSYRVFDGCVNRNEGSNLDYIEISPWGYTRDIGTTFISSGTKLLESIDCPISSSRIGIVSTSRSIFNAPNFSPYEPIYFFGFLAISIYIFILAFKTIVGKGYR
jgi:hypothetical protein